MCECGALIPFSRTHESGKTNGSCLLPEYHEGEHLFLDFDILKNENIFTGWEKIWDCSCEEYCECHIHGEVNAMEALRKLSDLPYLVQPLLAAPKRAVDPSKGQLEFELKFKRRP